MALPDVTTASIEPRALPAWLQTLVDAINTVELDLSNHSGDGTSPHGATLTQTNLTVSGHLFVPQVTDASMDATNGNAGEIVFNLADSKFYGCTTTGTPATWAALH